MECSTAAPEAHDSSSAAACGRPRGLRAVVDSASTSVRPRGVHVRRHRTRRRRLRGTAGGNQRRRRRRSARCTLTTGLPGQLSVHRPAICFHRSYMYFWRYMYGWLRGPAV